MKILWKLILAVRVICSATCYLHSLFTKKKKKIYEVGIYPSNSFYPLGCVCDRIDFSWQQCTMCAWFKCSTLRDFRVISLATSVYMCACIFMSIMISTKKERERRKGKRNTYNSCSNVIQENNVAKYFCETKM